MRWKKISALIFLAFSSLLLFYIVRMMLIKTDKELPYTSKLIIEKFRKNDNKISSFVVFERKIVLRNVDTLTCDFPSSRYFTFIDSLIVFINQDFCQIWVVDLNGKVKVFGGVGQGPGEFLRIDAFAVSPDGLIYVYDNINRRFSIFDLEGRIVKTINLKEELKPRHIAVDKYGNVYIHHPPDEKFPGFVSVFSSDGKILKTLQTDVDWRYLSYYNRGFLDGDILVTRYGKIIESNMFTPYLHIADIDSLNFRRIGKRLKGYSYPKINFDNPDEIRKLNLAVFGDLFSAYGDTIIFQLYLTPDELKDRRRSYPLYRVFDICGNNLGRLVGDIGLLLYCDDKYLVTVEPKLDPKIPFNFVIYRWKTLSEIAENENVEIKSFLEQFKDFKMVAFISSDDCSTCIEAIIREFIRFEFALGDGFDCSIVVVNKGSNYKNFLEDLRSKYGWKVYFYELNQKTLSIQTPSVYFRDDNGFMVIKPDISAISTFHSKVENLINKYSQLKQGKF